MAMVVNARSVYAEGHREALCFKWIESERAQRDLGQAAIDRWIKEHWAGYLRARWIEHIQGIRYYMEFDPGAFGLLQRLSHDPLLLDRILDRLEEGKENLDVINWAMTWQLPLSHVIDILEALDVNSCRLSCLFAESV